MFGFSIGVVILAVLITAVFIPLVFRRVVPTNMVHIVQGAKTTTSYGAHKDAGNVYYEWPSWVPFIGVNVIEMPVSNFDLSLSEYKAYDIDRVPFSVDVTAFFRIEDTNIAAQRVENYEELYCQLRAIVQGAVRTILASHKIDDIMLERSTFGEAFTNEVKEELESWGVTPVKNMELMDIQDAEGSQVIQNIMAKKKSFIEMESRKEVAWNMKDARQAEIDAEKDVAVRQQEAVQAVGERTAEQEKKVGVAKEKSYQEIKAQEKITKEREMDVIRVKDVKEAEILKDVQIVEATKEKEKTIIIAAGDLEAEKKRASGIEAVGKANADAEGKMQVARISGDMELAKEIGENEGYQTYLVNIRNVEANQEVGIAQAAALKAANIKVIANAGDVNSGVENAMQIFSPKGGTALGGMLEGLANTPQGRILLDSFNKAKNMPGEGWKDADEAM